MSREKRLRAGLFGRRAEQLAILFLRARGYRILGRTYIVRGGEIDIIARRGSALAFVEVKARPREVKARPRLEDALMAITPAKQRRMSVAARHWLGANEWAMRCSLRGDLVAIAPWRMPRDLVGAVELRLD
jgi:putative endonuclease